MAIQRVSITRRIPTYGFARVLPNVDLFQSKFKVLPGWYKVPTVMNIPESTRQNGLHGAGLVIVTLSPGDLSR